MSAPHIEIQKVATLARLKLTPQELKDYPAQLDRILAYMDVLTSHDRAGTEPTAHPMPTYDVLRQDESRPGLTREQALANAPRQTAGQFQIPKVVE